ncbi:uncharacterized protein LOC120480109 isoform X2 [Pimephales promelas]|uniref:uncharacterized protein LOC120480109 isoform X1 n=1 Tax=Pimephales promelas TaxID=90988 RepID=UPI0019555959|nr:uncharacterized protein LOC120480109 isoform X1 [Pimephales promelas]XP_039528986.1 uncharacterized protein LOC120480109 isoform X2 [Pimephales promelas]
MHTPSCVLISTLLMIANGFIVRGPSTPLVAPLGSSLVLPCYTDKPLPVKGLEVEWRRTDSETLVHLYQYGESRPEAQQQDYQDRAHFFTDQIQHGNFSLRLDNLTAEDEGNYTCKVYSQQDSGETEVHIKDVERLLVSGSSRSISAYAGDDVTLNCSIDSHIKPEHIEEVSWRKTDEDEDILVLLYLNNKAFPDSSDLQYRDRVEFFTDEIPKGNFSLRLKSVRTEDKGVYMCHVFAGVLSANSTVVLEQLGFSVSHIIILILCISASGSALLLWFPIYFRSQNTDSAAKPVRTLGFLHVFLPNIMMFVAFVLWGVTEGILYETIFCCALYILRPLMVINVAPYLKKISEFCLQSEFVIFMLVYFSVLLSRAWRNIVHYEGSEKIMIISVFGVVILLCVIFIIYLFTKNKKMPCHGEICKWMWGKVTDVAYFSFFILPSLQISLLFIAFGVATGGFIVSMIVPLFFFLSFSCLVGINKKKSYSNLLNIISWLIFMFIMTAVTVYFYSTSLKHEKDAVGWTCTAVFLQLLWMIAVYIQLDLGLTLTFKKVLYVFGSVVVVLLNSVTLMTELILKTVNGERAVGDLRVVLFSSESVFAFSLLILAMFEAWISDIKCRQCCQRAERTDDIPDTGLNQNQDSQNAAASDEASASGSNQNQN